jgi:hypothetical protein
MLAGARAELDQAQKSIKTLLERFAVSMKILHMSAVPSTAGRETSAPAVVHLAATPGKDPEAITLARSLANDLSKIQSELKLVEAEVGGVFELRKETEKTKEDVRGVKEEIRKDGQDRARELDDVRKQAAAAKTEVGTMKHDLEGMKLDVGNAYRGLGETKQEMGKLKAQQELLRATVEKVEQELGDVQEERGEVSVETEKQLGEVRKEIGQLRQMMGEFKQDTERWKKEVEERAATAKRDRSDSAPAGDAMDLDEPRPTKRVRLNVPVRAQSHEEAPLPPALTQDIGGPSNKRLKELYDKLEDYVATIESEIAQNHTDVSERLDQFAEHMGLAPIIDSGDTSAEGVASTSAAGRSESAPPALSPKSSRAGGMRSSAPPDVSTQRTKSAGSQLTTLKEGEVAAEVETMLTLRRDLDAVMAQFLDFWAAKGQWPDIVGKNLATAMGVQSLEQVWHKMAEATKSTAQKANPNPNRPEMNGAKRVNGTGSHKAEAMEGGTSDVMALVMGMQAEQAKMAKRMEEMEAKSRQSDQEKEALRVRLAEQDKELGEVSVS